jgi:UDP-N-acetylglucosamine 2-epimerase (non-hydrolysing)
MKILIVIGTRPEAIKMIPLVTRLKSEPDFETKICLTGQHREMLDQVMNIFNLHADFDLDVMGKAQRLADVTCRMLHGMDQLFMQWKPDFILVQGDTNTVFAAALAAFYNKIKVGHVEAGLRTGNRYSPWPEETNRMLTAQLADIHFAPTAASRDNLVMENIRPDSVFVTGNTVIDTLLMSQKIIEADTGMCLDIQNKFNFIRPNKRMILVTGHRRENFGQGFTRICRAIAFIAGQYDVDVVYPVHMNPNVREPVNEILGNHENIHLIEPVDYFSFIYLMQQSYMILTDSGGVQEEAPSLGKPVVVMRDTTERPEAVDAGTVVLAGTDYDEIVKYVSRLLEDEDFYNKMAWAHNPYGDGMAAERIVKILREKFICDSK